MNSPTRQLTECRVVDAGKLPRAVGGADQLCAAIERAAAAGGLGERFAVEVRVLSDSSLAATLTTADGKVLPEQKFASSDRMLNPDSIDRFAKSLAIAISSAKAR